MNTDESPKCPKCRAPLPSDAPQGLCPRCLAAMNLSPDTLTDEEAAGIQPSLTPDELAPHFPQLEIIECMGRGGMGVVYKARQKALGRLVALKLLAPERVKDPQFAERFISEARALAQLAHPHIVTVHDFGHAGDFFFLLMEFVDGVNLRQALNAGRFTPEQALSIVPPVCEALQYAHENGIVHRDIKPENLLLDKSGRVKIADFGIAKILRQNSPSNEHEDSHSVGTPQYMAPEQRSSPGSSDHRADIYSLGVVLYEMLTGELPSAKLQPPSRKVTIDVRLDEIVMRALERSPDLRWQTAADLRTHVETITSPAAAEEAGNAISSRKDAALSQRQSFASLAWEILLIGWLFPTGLTLIYFARWLREIVVPTLKGGNFDQLYDLHGNVRYLDSILVFSVIAFCWFGLVWLRFARSPGKGASAPRWKVLSGLFVKMSPLRRTAAVVALVLLSFAVFVTLFTESRVAPRTIPLHQLDLPVEGSSNPPEQARINPIEWSSDRDIRLRQAELALQRISEAQKLRGADPADWEIAKEALRKIAELQPQGRPTGTDWEVNRSGNRVSRQQKWFDKETGREITMVPGVELALAAPTSPVATPALPGSRQSTVESNSLPTINEPVPEGLATPSVETPVKNASGVPILSEIPHLGRLFRNAAADRTNESSEAAGIRLRAAADELKRASALKEQHLISIADYEKVETAFKIAQAELAGDRVEIARIRLRAAENALKRAGTLWEEHFISNAEYQEAETAFQIAQAEFKKASADDIRPTPLPPQPEPVPGTEPAR